MTNPASQEDMNRASEEGANAPPNPEHEENVEALPQWARDALTKANREAASYRKQAKENAKAADELTKLREQSMSEQEKAVAKARDEGAAEARAQLAIGRAEDAIRFSIGDRLPSDEVDDLIDHVNLARFVRDDGTVDRERVAKYVERVAPAKKGFPDLGQGARGGNGKGDMNSFLAQAIRNARK